MDPRSELADDGSPYRRACDQCRLRKIKCDRRIPCASCTTAKQTCSSTGVRNRPREPRRRAAMASESEKRMSYMEARLERLTSLVETMAQSGQNSHSSSSPRHASPGIDPPTPTPSDSVIGSTLVISSKKDQAEARPDRSLDGSVFQGNSSVTAHAAFASKFLENALTRHTQIEDAHPNMRVAITSLQQLLQMQSQHSIVAENQLQYAKPVRADELSNLPMPPMGPILDVLRDLRDHLPVTFTLICAFDSTDAFTRYCQRVYFPTEEISQATFIIVNAGLYYILQEREAVEMQAGNETAASNFQAYSDMCRDNLETALMTLNLLMAPCKENVEALIMAASYATEISKPSLAWQLNAAACQLCLALGYHQTELLMGETPATKSKRAVKFWLVYILDKALALRFGRSPVLQDYDITLSPILEPLDQFDDHRETIHGWIAHAEAQGKTYTQLYSPVALTRPVEQRVQLARSCAESLLREVQKLKEPRMQSEAAGSPDNNSKKDAIASILLKSDQVSLLSTLTLVYRAVPPGTMGKPPGASITFCEECIDVAREVVQVHIEAAQLLQDNPRLVHAYMHWAILFSPFIPFIVLFCNAIETRDLGDLTRVENFKNSLEPFRNSSEPVDRLYRLCEVLYNAAAVYFEQRQSSSENSSRDQTHDMLLDVPGSNGFDAYLNQLPVLAMDEGGMIGHGMDSTPVGQVASGFVGSHANLVANWYSGYTNMVGWSEFSPSNWPQ